MQGWLSKLDTISKDDFFVDRWLRFAPDLDQQYELENHTDRSRHLRETIYVGLVLFNVHNITNAFLTADIIWLTVFVRLIVFTPIVLIFTFYLTRLSPILRERMVVVIVTTAFASECAFFLATQSSLGNYVFSEFGLTLVYGNMLVALRFRHAIILTAFSFLLACLVVWQKPFVDDAIRFAFVVQIAMACIISLYANYKTERRRCHDYLVAHLAGMQAEQSEDAKRLFQDQSRTDALTGLANRRLLDESLEAWFAEDLPVAVIMIDIDHFKIFNDTMGHPAGDDCLRQIGAVLIAAQTRDIQCARFGGEEFIVAIRSGDSMGVTRIANSLIRSIEALEIAHPERPDRYRVVTASGGVASRLPGRLSKPQDVISAADRSLYCAKRMGRNRFVFDEPDESVRTAAA